MEWWANNRAQNGGRAQVKSKKPALRFFLMAEIRQNQH